ncbi:MAG: nucleotidyl transferase AbiEii/AbiGii toxin family protein [Deltaproteobacteria bacterium]|nr:nucleotidyl transferase AbiEii/AbiGii toxin family protein [Deltaproteobacteria bacterium]
MKMEMLKKVSRSRNSQERLNLLREELHHLILQEVDRKGGFRSICFLGGTALRIIYGLDRFSEDLDFSISLKEKKPFHLEPLAKNISQSLTAFGVDCEVGKLRVIQAVHSCFFKFSNLLNAVDSSFRKGQKLVVKFDVDTNPPKGAHESVTPISGEHLYKVRHYDLPSLFAGKLHAILFRPFTKGRDLYDFLWYRGKKVEVNRTLLEYAAAQTQKVKFDATPEALQSALKERFEKIDFKKAKQDVERFLTDPHALSLFDKELFLTSVEGLR